jgi:ubiquitin carboxyl-terminal hydrolase 14
MVKVTVKWGKEKYDDVDLDTKGDLNDFKAILYSITNVPGPKQKILYKGSVIKVYHFKPHLILQEGADLSALNIPDVRVYHSQV